MQVADPTEVTAIEGFRQGCFPSALVNAPTQMQQSQVAQTAQFLVLKKAMDIQATCALALLQALPLATSGNLGTQVNTMA